MKYSKIETHKFAPKICDTNCLIDINTLIVKEGCSEPMPIFTNNEEVIDMDFVEINLAKAQKRTQNKSMDVAFVVNLGSPENNEVVLTEFRFNYVNLKNLKKTRSFWKSTRLH